MDRKYEVIRVISNGQFLLETGALKKTFLEIISHPRDFFSFLALSAN